MSRRSSLFKNAILLRCPNCGTGGLVRHWLKVADDCPACGISLVRGNRVGAYIINMAVSESLTVGLIIGVIVGRWPDVPWEFLTWAAPLLAILSPLAFYPFARLLFVAVDIAVHPQAHRDEDPAPPPAD